MTEKTETSTDQETPPCPSWCVEDCSQDNGMGAHGSLKLHLYEPRPLNKGSEPMLSVRVEEEAVLDELLSDLFRPRE
ncbi:hypothetical protein ACFXJ5_18065 [Streptomyces sp. NPDC059373]